MRLLLLTLLLTLAACSKNDSLSCQEPEERELLDWEFADGETRKSSVLYCSNNCYKLVSTDNPEINELYCD